MSEFNQINPDLRTIGRGGKDLYKYFEERGGPEAYLGTTSIPGFPNFFTFLGTLLQIVFISTCTDISHPLGPNVASGHVSAIFSEEQQVNKD